MSCGLADAVRYYPIIGGVGNEEGAEQSTWFHFVLRIIFIIHYVCIQVDMPKQYNYACLILKR